MHKSILSLSFSSLCGLVLINTNISHLDYHKIIEIIHSVCSSVSEKRRCSYCTHFSHWNIIKQNKTIVAKSMATMFCFLIISFA